MITADVIAAVSVLIAGVALVQSWLTGRKQVLLQDRLTQIEQSREHARLMQLLQATIRAELCETDRGSWRLFVFNTGQGTARNIVIKLDDEPLLEPEVKIIGPESKISYYMPITIDEYYPPFEFEATWDDDSGQQGRYGTTLTF